MNYNRDQKFEDHKFFLALNVIKEKPILNHSILKIWKTSANGEK